MATFEPRTVLPDDLSERVYVHVIGASVWTDSAPFDASWTSHVVGVLDGAAWYAVDVPADIDPSDGAKLDLYGYHGRAGQGRGWRPGARCSSSSGAARTASAGAAGPRRSRRRASGRCAARRAGCRRSRAWRRR
jgi:hypothetical protein